MSGDDRSRPRLVGFVDDGEIWFEGQPIEDRKVMYAHLTRKASGFPHQAITLDGVVFHTFVRIDRALIWGYRIDYSIYEMAIVVLGGRTLHR